MAESNGKMALDEPQCQSGSSPVAGPHQGDQIYPEPEVGPHPQEEEVQEPVVSFTEVKPITYYLKSKYFF